MKKWITKHTPFVLFITVILIGLFVSPNIGVSWDEPDNIYAGGVYWNFFRNGLDRTIIENPLATASYFGGRIYSQQTDLARYPPVPNYAGTAIAVALEQLGIGRRPAVIIIAFHLGTGIFFGILVAMVFRFGKLLGFSHGWSLLAACTAFLYPTLFGYGFSNLKDTAQAAMFILSLYVLIKASLSIGKSTLDPGLPASCLRSSHMQAGNQSVKLYQYLVLGAVLWGLALATKFNAIYVPIIWLVWFVLGKRLDVSGHGFRSAFLSAMFYLLVIIFIGIFVAFLVWPYLWFDPVGRVLEVVRYFTTVGQGYAVFWNGDVLRVGVGQPLWWYPWGHLLINTPGPILLLAAVGIVRAVRNYKKYGILLIWFTIPLFRALLPNAAFYDGLRHFVEVLPAFILLSILGLQDVALVWPKTAHVGAVAIVLHLVIINVSLFPYSSAYTNFLISDPSVRFDQDIEALSVRESLDWLHRTYGAIRVYIPIGRHLGWYVLWPQDHDAYRLEDADTVVLVNKLSHLSQLKAENKPGDAFFLVHTIVRGQTTLAWIYRKQQD